MTGVKTNAGFSMLLIERGEGVETTQIKTSYSTTAGTAYIKFDNVKVPVENLLGVEDQGFKVIMTVSLLSYGVAVISCTRSPHT